MLETCPWQPVHAPYLYTLGAMKGILTVAMEVLLSRPPQDTVILWEASMYAYKM